MSMLISDDRCGECYGAGENENWDRVSQNFTGEYTQCESCKGTGRKMSDLCKELFDVLAEHFDIKPKGRR